jgi:hypothetical protein
MDLVILHVNMFCASMELRISDKPYRCPIVIVEHCRVYAYIKLCSNWRIQMISCEARWWWVAIYSAFVVLHGCACLLATPPIYWAPIEHQNISWLWLAIGHVSGVIYITIGNQLIVETGLGTINHRPSDPFRYFMIRLTAPTWGTFSVTKICLMTHRVVDIHSGPLASKLQVANAIVVWELGFVRFALGTSNELWGSRGTITEVVHLENQTWPKSSRCIIVGQSELSWWIYRLWCMNQHISQGIPQWC